MKMEVVHVMTMLPRLVQDHTSTSDATGEPLLKDTKEDTKVVEPHFNKEFLSGTNSKNAKLGDVYNNVAFPFTKKQIFDEDKALITGTLTARIRPCT